MFIQQMCLGFFFMSWLSTLTLALPTFEMQIYKANIFQNFVKLKLRITQFEFITV